MSRGQDFLGCSQDVFHRNQSDENEFCSQENWQGAVICLAQVNTNSDHLLLIFILHQQQCFAWNDFLTCGCLRLYRVLRPIHHTKTAIDHVMMTREQVPLTQEWVANHMLRNTALIIESISGVYILAISPPPWRGGGKKRHFLEFGEENRPLEKKKFQNKKKLKIFLKTFSQSQI